MREEREERGTQIEREIENESKREIKAKSREEKKEEKKLFGWFESERETQ